MKRALSVIVCILVCMACFVACTERGECKHNDLVMVAAKDATCTEDGNVSYWHCGGCSKNFADAKAATEITDVVVAAGHKLTKVNAKKATCTESGNIEYWHCGVCLKNYADAEAKEGVVNVTVNASHELTEFPANDATCLEDGNVRYWHCGGCLKNFADSEAWEELGEVIIPAGHKFGGYEYNYDDKAYHRTCSVDGAVEDKAAGSEEFPLLARSEDELKAVVAAAGENDFIKLSSDITVTSVNYNVVYRLPSGGTLDLGGHTVSVTKAPGGFVVEGTDVTVKNGTVNLVNGGDYALFIGDEGDDNAVTVKGITANAGFNVYNCVATVIDCDVDASACTYYALWGDEHSTVIVRSGSYVGGETACIHSTSSADPENRGNIIIYGGEFTGDIIATDRTEIHGGSFSGIIKLTQHNSQPPYLLVDKDYGGTLDIVCGVSGYDVSETLDADGNRIYRITKAETAAA